MARREERGYSAYLSDEQHRQSGCAARELCRESLFGTRDLGGLYRAAPCRGQRTSPSVVIGYSERRRARGSAVCHTRHEGPRGRFHPRPAPLVGHRRDRRRRRCPWKPGCSAGHYPGTHLRARGHDARARAQERRPRSGRHDRGRRCGAPCARRAREERSRGRPRPRRLCWNDDWHGRDEGAATRCAESHGEYPGLRHGAAVRRRQRHLHAQLGRRHRGNQPDQPIGPLPGRARHGRARALRRPRIGGWRQAIWWQPRCSASPPRASSARD